MFLAFRRSCGSLLLEVNILGLSYMSNSILNLMFINVHKCCRWDIINPYYGSRYLFKSLLGCSTFHLLILILVHLFLLDLFQRLEHAIRIKLSDLMFNLLHLIFALNPFFLEHNLKRSQRPLNCNKGFIHGIYKLNGYSILKHIDSLLCLFWVCKLDKSKSFAHFAFLILRYANMLDVASSLKDLSQLFMIKFFRDMIHIDHRLI